MSEVSYSTQTKTVEFPQYTWSLMRWSFVIGLIPVLALIIALAINSFYLLQYVHVLCGGTWTGFDLFMGLVMTRIMRNLDITARVEVAKRLTPTTFFIMPSLASVTIAAGIYVAQKMGIFDLNSPWIIAAGIVVLILSGQGFGVFMPNGLRIFIELSKPKPNVEKIAKLNMQNIRLAGSQAFFQVVLILIMAHLAVLGPY